MVGGSVKVIDMNGRTVHQQKLDSTSLRLDGNALLSNSYFIEFENKGVNLKKKLIVIE
jgi:hypothetical protein